MGAGYKSRCSDEERWHQFCSNEYLWATSETNFQCPFRFISKELNAEEKINDKDSEYTALGKMNDKLIFSSSKIRSISLEEFNIKKIDLHAFDKWESDMSQKCFSKRKIKSEHDGSSSRPKLKTQRSKLFQGLPTKSNEIENNPSDLKIYNNPIYYMIKNEAGVKEKLAKIMEFRSLKVPKKTNKHKKSRDTTKLTRHESPHKASKMPVRTQSAHISSCEFVEKESKRKKFRTLRRSLVKNVSSSPREEETSPSKYRTYDKKKIETSIDVFDDSNLFQKKKEKSSNVRERSVSEATPLSFLQVSDKDKRIF